MSEEEISKYWEEEFNPLNVAMTAISNLIISILQSLLIHFGTNCSGKWRMEFKIKLFQGCVLLWLNKNDIYMLYYANVKHCLPGITFHGDSSHFWCYFQNWGWGRSFVYGNLTCLHSLLNFRQSKCIFLPIIIFPSHHLNTLQFSISSFICTLTL